MDAPLLKSASARVCVRHGSGPSAARAGVLVDRPPAAATYQAARLAITASRCREQGYAQSLLERKEGPLRDGNRISALLQRQVRSIHLIDAGPVLSRLFF